MSQESNFRCKCGEPLMLIGDGLLHHRMYHCSNCNEIYAVKGQDHYMICDEIDLSTGKIIPMEETEKGKKYVEEEEKRLRKLYPNEYPKKTALKSC